MPWRGSDSPTGPVGRPTAVRQRPSNMKLLVVRGPGSQRSKARVYHPSPETRGVSAAATPPLTLTPTPPRSVGRVLQAWSQALWSRPEPAGGINPGRRPARIHHCDIRATPTTEDHH